MRTKTVEVPICGFGRCPRDGIVLQVVPTNGREPFLIARCDRHLEQLAHEHADEAPQPAPSTSSTSAIERAVALVAEDPGRSSAQYVAAGATRYALSRAVQAGMLRAEGRTSARRYFLP